MASSYRTVHDGNYFYLYLSGLMSMEPWGLFSTSTSQDNKLQDTGSSDVSLELLPDPRELKDKDGVKKFSGRVSLATHMLQFVT